MTEHDKTEFAVALAELYIKRRQEYWSAIDRVQKIRAAIKEYTQAFILQQDRIKQLATAKWDQLVEVIDLLPADIREAIMQEVARLE
ncbi:hypothetical protein [Paenibacillus sp. DMB5]|uniref:hypothetical protein n=1 Tax=Paenibacillus sp. DMB5 TaxID=1780103 RepID=UPI00076CDA61|nr:hypothetical protein [Paenibacillus sp. DMB5]KUP22369.1 hypothetical protein AWJ19_27510 [Paenibacillus sp. DMB5]